MPDIIADFPAYRIYKANARRRFKHGDKIAVPFESRNYGTLYNIYTLGTVAGYAIETGGDPVEAIERCKENMAKFPYNGHKLFWASQDAVCIHNGPHRKEEYPGFNFGDTIILQGHSFRIEKAPNDNISLIEV